MQQVAREMNLSETAFLQERADGSYDLRWFTPSVEVDLCGHATLAAAHILWQTGRLAPDATARFHTRSGLLTATTQNGWITMDFPEESPQAHPLPDGLRTALGAEILWSGRNRMDWFVRIATADAVRTLQPDLSTIGTFTDVRGIIVTAPADTDDLDFISRFFAPAAGVPEDPVTGSAHCALGPYWHGELGRNTIVGYQASQRGGTVRVHVQGDRVLLSGQAVTMLEMTLMAGD